MPEPYYKLKLPHWTLERRGLLFGYVLDRFCVRRRYHVMVSKDAPAPGWHISFRCWCSDPTNRVPRSEWEPDIEELSRRLGVAFQELYTSPQGVTHFHQQRR